MSPHRPLPDPRGLALCLVLLLVPLSAWGCGAADEEAAAEVEAPPPGSPLADRCAPDDDGLSLPEGFCAIVASEGVGPARHIDVRENGDVFVALRSRRSRDGGGEEGGVVALRDTDGDGRLDQEERWGGGSGNEVLLDGESLWYVTDEAVLRYRLPVGSLTPASDPDTVVSGLPADRDHTAKSLALGPEGALFVNMGAPSNACMEKARTLGSPGVDPCPQLETRGGIWRFEAGRTGQTQADGRRFATGLRNVVALATHPRTGQLYGVFHGRDQLHDLFPEMFTEEQSAEKPAEEFVALDEGDDFGWPYCYYDPASDTKVLAPEYGGDGTTIGRCAEKEDPLIDFPAHWAPNDLTFYTASAFPAPYRNGAFIAFHGSWNRAPLPQQGYNVVFAPFQGDRPSGEWKVFADGFRPEPPAGEDAEPAEGARPSARPVGVAVDPDGSLWVADSRAGRIWRIVYRGGGA